MVSGSPDVSSSLVSQPGNSFVSQSDWWCPKQLTIGVLNSLLRGFHLFAGVGVRVSGCLSPQKKSLVICLPAWLVVSGSLEVSLHFLPSICLLVVSGSQDVRFYLVSSSADVSLYLSPFICLRMSLFKCFPSFVSSSLDVSLSRFVFPCAEWRPALQISLFAFLLPLLSPVLCPAFRMSLLTCFPESGFPDVSLYLSPCICLPVCWWCPALRMSLFTLSSGVPIGGVQLSGSPSLNYLFPFICVPSGVRLSRCLSSFFSFHLSPSVPTGVRLSGWFSSFQLSPFICLPSLILPLHLCRLSG